MFEMKFSIEEQKKAFAEEHGVPLEQVKVRLSFQLFAHPLCWQYCECLCSLPFSLDEVVGAIVLSQDEWTAKFPKVSVQDVLRCLELNHVPPLDVLRYDLVL